VRAKRIRVSVGAGVSGIRVPYLDQLRKHTMGASSVFSWSLPFPSMAITTNPSPEPAGSFDHKLDLSVSGRSVILCDGVGSVVELRWG
jgi:hypothetical protein